MVLTRSCSHEYGNNKKQIAPGGWHCYGKSVWKNPKIDEEIYAEKDTGREGFYASKKASY